MKNKIEMKLSVPDFMTNTRVRYCNAINCKHLADIANELLQCELKVITINNDGVCNSFIKNETESIK